jgi:MFS family permease
VPTSWSVLTGNRDFRRLFIAQLIVFGADWFVWIPLLDLLPKLTGSGVMGGLVLVADTAVATVLLPYGGVLADRLDRRTTMLIANVGAVAAAGLLFAVQGPSTAWLAPVAVGLMSVAKSFYSPAANAALPNLVSAQELRAANVIGGSAWGTMSVIAASVGGVLTAAVGPYNCFVVTVVALVLAAVVVWPIKRPMQAQPPAAGAAGEVEPAGERDPQALKEARRYIRQHPQVLSLVTVKSAVGMGNGVLITFPLLAALFHAGEAATGFLFAIRGLGALLGPWLLSRVLKHPKWLLPGMAISMATYGVAYLGVSIAPWFWLVIALVFVAHLAGGGNWTMSAFAIQAVVPDRLRGRVIATDMTLATLAIATSQLLATLVVDHVQLRVLIAACGAVTFCYAIIWRLMTMRLNRAADPALATVGTGELS